MKLSEMPGNALRACSANYHYHIEWRSFTWKSITSKTSLMLVSLMDVVDVDASDPH